MELKLGSNSEEASTGEEESSDSPPSLNILGSVDVSLFISSTISEVLSCSLHRTALTDNNLALSRYLPTNTFLVSLKTEGLDL